MIIASSLGLPRGLRELIFRMLEELSRGVLLEESISRFLRTHFRADPTNHRKTFPTSVLKEEKGLLASLIDNRSSGNDPLVTLEVSNGQLYPKIVPEFPYRLPVFDGCHSVNVLQLPSNRRKVLDSWHLQQIPLGFPLFN